MRYLLTSPVPNGHAFWLVTDTWDGNKTAISINGASVPNAEELARECCDRLNGKSAPEVEWLERMYGASH